MRSYWIRIVGSFCLDVFFLFDLPATAPILETIAGIKTQRTAQKFIYPYFV